MIDINQSTAEGSRHRTGLTLLIAALALLMGGTPPARALERLPATIASGRLVAADPQPLVTAQVLRRACLRLWTNEDAAEAQPALLNFCNTKIQIDPGLTLRAVDRAAVEQVPVLARQLSEAEWDGFRGKPHELEMRLTQGATEAGGDKDVKGLADVQSALIWGFAEFVAGKAKEQADLYLVQRFVDRICGPAEGKRMLPSTCAQLGTVDALVDAVRLPSLIRTAARADATVAPVVLTHLVLERNPNLVAQHLDQAASGEMMVAGLFSAIGGKPWEQALGAMASDGLVGARRRLSLESAPVASMLYLVGLLSRSLDMPVRTLAAEFGSDTLGAIWAQRAMLVNLKLGRPYLAPTAAGREIWDCVPGGSGNPYCSLSGGSRIAFRIFQGASQIAPWVDTVRAAASGSRAGALRKLSDKVLGEFSELAEMSGKPVSTTPVGSTWSQVNAIVSAYAEQQHLTAAMLLLQLPDSMGLDLTLPPNVVRGLTVTATLADADSASAVVSALNALVAGSRTYMHKRTKSNGFSIGVNAYAGGNAGWETVVRAGSAKSKASSFAGAYVPLGLELAWPADLMPGVRSVSVLLQAIDVGALTSWRLQSSGDVDQEPRVTAAQVFSPGAHVVLGLSRMPLSLGVGVSIAPRIRQVTSNGISEQKSALRIPVFLAMDIPLFP